MRYVFPNGMPRPDELDRLPASPPVIAMECLTEAALSRLVIDIALSGRRGLVGAYHVAEDLFEQLESGRSVIVIDDQLSPVIVPAECAMAVAGSAPHNEGSWQAVVA